MKKTQKKKHFFPLPPAPSPGYSQDPDPDPEQGQELSPLAGAGVRNGERSETAQIIRALTQISFISNLQKCIHDFFRTFLFKKDTIPVFCFHSSLNITMIRFVPAEIVSF